MTHSICDIYPSLNPFTVRKERAYEVFRLMKLIRLNNEYGDKGEKVQSNGTVRRNVTGKRGTGGWI